MAFDRLPDAEQLERIADHRRLIAQNGLAEFGLEPGRDRLGDPGAAADIDGIAVGMLAQGAPAKLVGQLHVIAGFDPWWGGHSYGARYTTGLVPWFVLLAVLGLKAMLDWETRRGASVTTRRRALLACGALLLGLSVFINARGAMAHATWRWNVLPANVDEHPERIWDWRDPQFLARDRAMK